MLALVILLPNKATCFRAYRKGGEQIVHTFGMAEVRIVVKDGEPWFVAKDVAEVLGYAQPDKAVRDHCKGVFLLNAAESAGLTSSPRGITIIPQKRRLPSHHANLLGGVQRDEVFDGLLRTRFCAPPKG